MHLRLRVSSERLVGRWLVSDDVMNASWVFVRSRFIDWLQQRFITSCMNAQHSLAKYVVRNRHGAAAAPSSLILLAKCECSPIMHIIGLARMYFTNVNGVLV